MGKVSGTLPTRTISSSTEAKGTRFFTRLGFSIYNAAWYTLKMGKGVETENMAVYIIKVRKKILGDEHSDTLNRMAIVGLAHSLNGR